jgi:hypothetical protein
MGSTSHEREIIEMRANNNAGCLTAFLSSFSRWVLLFYWIARPVQMNAAFNTFIFPCLGLLFLPLTTLMYVLLIQGVGAIQGLDWLWLILALVLDLATLGGAGYANRNRIPAGYPGSGQTPAAVQAPAAPEQPVDSTPKSS